MLTALPQIKFDPADSFDLSSYYYEANGNTILHYVVEHQWYPVLTMILQYQAFHKIDRTNRVNKSAIDLAIEKGDSTALEIFLNDDASRKVFTAEQIEIMLALYITNKCTLSIGSIVILLQERSLVIDLSCIQSVLEYDITENEGNLLEAVAIYLQATLPDTRIKINHLLLTAMNMVKDAAIIVERLIECLVRPTDQCGEVLQALLAKQEYELAALLMQRSSETRDTFLQAILGLEETQRRKFTLILFRQAQRGSYHLHRSPDVLKSLGILFKVFMEEEPDEIALSIQEQINFLQLVPYYLNSHEEQTSFAQVMLKNLFTHCANQQTLLKIVEQLENLAKANKINYLYLRQGLMQFSFLSPPWKGNNISETWTSLMEMANTRLQEFEPQPHQSQDCEQGSLAATPAFAASSS